jgi:hypothetical protein
MRTARWNQRTWRRLIARYSVLTGGLRFWERISSSQQQLIL